MTQIYGSVNKEEMQWEFFSLRPPLFALKLAATAVTNQAKGQILSA